MPIKNIQKIRENLPAKPGVYFFKDADKKILYIGKAISLKSRVSSYFRGAHDNRIEQMLEKAKYVEWKELDSAVEALIFEAHLIRRHKPKYNVLEKDDKTFVHMGITAEDFPKVVIVRSTEISRYKKFKKIYGPFPSATSARLALKILRKIFPFRTKCQPLLSELVEDPSTHVVRSGNKKRGCLDYQIGLCPGVCAGLISKKEYLKNIHRLIKFFEGEKESLIQNLKKEMARVSKKEDFEQAKILRDQIFSLEHIRDGAFMREENFIYDVGTRHVASLHNHIPSRIEAYDISHTGGELATGSMVVFTYGKIDSAEYRQFRIKNIAGANDPAQMAEVLSRRLGHTEWTLPDVILLDGGLAQLRAAEKILDLYKIRVPLIALAKGATRKGRKLFFSKNAPTIDIKLLEGLRDEAHRFAIQYHRLLRKKYFLPASGILRKDIV